jgi:hypothetical protein
MPEKKPPPEAGKSASRPDDLDDAEAADDREEPRTAGDGADGRPPPGASGEDF